MISCVDGDKEVTNNQESTEPFFKTVVYKKIYHNKLA